MLVAPLFAVGHSQQLLSPALPQATRRTLLSLPPRPRVPGLGLAARLSRSFSFSDSASAARGDKKQQAQGEVGAGRGRAQSVCGLQSWPGEEEAHLQRSHSLASLQPRASCCEGAASPAPARASIWSRARAESFRNLRELAGREGGLGSSRSLTPVTPPQVPARTRRHKAAAQAPPPLTAPPPPPATALPSPAAPRLSSFSSPAPCPALSASAPASPALTR